MDHVVYVDAKAHELDQLLSGSKTMIIRGASGRKLPHGRVRPGDDLYFIQNNGEGCVQARARVIGVFDSQRLSPEECAAVVQEHQPQLQLTPNQTSRWSGKRYLTLITVGEVRAVTPFAIDKSAYGNMDDWLPVEDVSRVRAA
jgi:hypothetical protein